jgi:alkylated DNA repair protein alkB homolog 1
VDDAEAALERPIISFSLGHAGVFLLGGATRDEPPLALMVRSGDAIVMGGAARLCYHGEGGGGVGGESGRIVPALEMVMSQAAERGVMLMPSSWGARTWDGS